MSLFQCEHGNVYCLDATCVGMCTHIDTNGHVSIYFCIQVYKDKQLDPLKINRHTYVYTLKKHLRIEVAYTVLILCYASDVLLGNYVISSRLLATSKKTQNVTPKL